MEQQKLDSYLDTTPTKIKQSCQSGLRNQKLSKKKQKSKAAELPDSDTDLPQQDIRIEDQTQSTTSEVDTDTGPYKRRQSKLAGAEEKTCDSNGYTTQREALHSYLGPWEVEEATEQEESTELEVDLHQHVKCEKNPGHENFIPISKFTINYLPSLYQRDLIFKYIECVSHLTCRLLIKYISKNRPDLVPGTSKPYPFIQKRGKKCNLFATGWVSGVEIYQNKDCECEACQRSSKKVTHFAVIKICTAAHAVFDDEEAKSTTCHLSFDFGGIPKDCEGVKELNGSAGFHHEINSDEAEIGYVTHDLDLAEDLLRKYSDMLEYRACAHKLLLDIRPETDDHPLVVIVSHPHGCSKMVSVGHCVDVEENSSHIQLIYTASTCRGSSGAPVIFLGTRFWYRASAHTGKRDSGTLNFSMGRYFLPAGNWMTKINFTEEADLRQDFHRCKKNPGHEEFIPVGTFSAKHLPPGFRDITVLEYFRAWADLTARFTTRHTRKTKPKMQPGDDKQYQGAAHHGTSVTGTGWVSVTGTGWVDQVRLFPNEFSDVTKTCDCNVCQNSPSPRKDFAHIKFIVSRHIVSDDSEAENASCDLFFDNGLTPTECPTCVKLRGMSVVWANTETDSCMIKHTTHDLKLALLLKRKLEYLSALENQIAPVFADMKSRDEPTLSVIVSHPHGCSKQISVGSRVSDGVDNLLTYDTATCPGSSGAPVISDRHKFVVCFTSIHSGNRVHAKQINYSCCSSSFY